jgi:hypothetical protein
LSGVRGPAFEVKTSGTDFGQRTLLYGDIKSA